MGVSGGAFALVLVGLAYYFYRRHRRRKTTNVETSFYSGYGSGSDILEKGGIWQPAAYDQPDGMITLSRYHTPRLRLGLKLTEICAKAMLPGSEVRDITRFPKMKVASGDGQATNIYLSLADQGGFGGLRDANIGSQDPLYELRNSTEHVPSDISLSSDEDEAGLPLPFLRKAASNEEEAHRQALLLHEELAWLPPRSLLGSDLASSAEPSNKSPGSTPKQWVNHSPSTAPSTLSASGSQSSKTHSTSPSTLATSLSSPVPSPAKVASILKAPSVPLRAAPEVMATTKEMLTSMSTLFKRGPGIKYVPTFAEVKDKGGGGRSNVRFGEDQIKEFGGSAVDVEWSAADADYFEP